MNRLILLGLTVLFPALGFAIVSPSQATAETNPLGSQGLNWDYVANFNNSSAVAIAPRWLITAAHVADDFGNTTFTVGGTTVTQIGEVYHPTADFALIEVDTDLPGYYGIYSGAFTFGPPESRDEVLMVGYGGVGNVVNQTNYTVNTTGRGTKRWGTNKIDAVGGYVGGFGNPNLGIQMFFDTTDSFNEAGGSIGDSGGAVFIQSGSTWRLAGIMTDVSTGGSADSTLALAPQAYSDFIYAIIPEVSPVWMVAGGFALFCCVKRFGVPSLRRNS